MAGRSCYSFVKLGIEVDYLPEERSCGFFPAILIGYWLHSLY